MKLFSPCTFALTSSGALFLGVVALSPLSADPTPIPAPQATTVNVVAPALPRISAKSVLAPAVPPVTAVKAVFAARQGARRFWTATDPGLRYSRPCQWHTMNTSDSIKSR